MGSIRTRRDCGALDGAEREVRVEMLHMRNGCRDRVVAIHHCGKRAHAWRPRINGAIPPQPLRNSRRSLRSSPLSLTGQSEITHHGAALRAPHPIPGINPPPGAQAIAPRKAMELGR
jgi:hypothetical protein